MTINYWKQINPWACGPASAMMILNTLGKLDNLSQKTENKFYETMRGDILGTTVSGFVKFVEGFGVQVEVWHDITSEQKSQVKAIRDQIWEAYLTNRDSLNLNNVTENTALWYNFDCENELNNGNEVTIKDGRKDGKEGITAATKELAAINPTFVQDKVWASLTATGVTATETNLFAKYNGGTITTPTNATDPIYVIPNGDNLKVTIEYDVLTKDNNLVGKLNDGVTNGSVVKNVITRYITSTSQVGDPTTGSLKLAAGKQYTIKLHLGLNSVEFDADVKAWDTPIAGGADLPHNN